jgi:hypothetical protein
MAMLLIDGRVAIVDASAVESNCAVLQSVAGCQAAVSIGDAELTATRSFLQSDTGTGVSAAEQAIEIGLVTTLGRLLTDLGTCGPYAVFALGGTSISSVIDVSFYWSALTGCASPSAPFFVAQVTAIQAWYRGAQAYAGP